MKPSQVEGSCRACKVQGASVQGWIGFSWAYSGWEVGCWDFSSHSAASSIGHDKEPTKTTVLGRRISIARHLLACEQKVELILDAISPSLIPKCYGSCMLQ